MTEPTSPVESTRRVVLHWPLHPGAETSLADVEAAWNAWITEVRAQGCPDNARVGSSMDRIAIRVPDLIVQWDAKDDVDCSTGMAHADGSPCVDGVPCPDTRDATDRAIKVAHDWERFAAAFLRAFGSEHAVKRGPISDPDMPPSKPEDPLQPWFRERQELRDALRDCALAIAFQYGGCTPGPDDPIEDHRMVEAMNGAYRVLRRDGGRLLR